MNIKANNALTEVFTCDFFEELNCNWQYNIMRLLEFSLFFGLQGGT